LVEHDRIGKPEATFPDHALRHDESRKEIKNLRATADDEGIRPSSLHAALHTRAATMRLAICGDLSRDGVAILYVPHRLEEVLDLSDRITVLRDGRMVDEAARGHLDKKGLAAESRRRIFDLVASRRLLVAGGHLHMPGFAYVMREGNFYRWVPERWSVVV
jgi:hypothetical protein